MVATLASTRGRVSGRSDEVKRVLRAFDEGHR